MPHNNVVRRHPVRSAAARPQGSVSIIDPPTPGASWPLTPSRCATIRLTRPRRSKRRRSRTNRSSPARSAIACPIKHVLYIIKENRTYDQVFGDMKDASGKPLGNGEPKICMFGEDVTPNQHQLARDYVLLDNLYCNSEVSVDGHSWCDGASPPISISAPGSSATPSTASCPATAERTRRRRRRIWDLCRRNGVSFMCYGEGAGRVPTANRGTWDRKRRDMDRVEGWIKDLHKAEKTGETAAVHDHVPWREPHARHDTRRLHARRLRRQQRHRPSARSSRPPATRKFWNEMAIFIVEDDAQNGPDHVDAHRTVGLVDLAPTPSAASSTPRTTRR